MHDRHHRTGIAASRLCRRRLRRRQSATVRPLLYPGGLYPPHPAPGREGPGYLQSGWWSAQLRVSVTHAIVADVRALGLEPRIERSYGEERAIVAFPQERHPDFFRLVDRYMGDLPAWRFAEVFGLPSS